MYFYGLSKTFSTKNNLQYETIGSFWNELSEKYGIDNLKGLGYHWTSDSIEYVIGLKKGIIDNANCSVELPDNGWVTVHGKTENLSLLYEKIYMDGNIKYEIETFTDHGECEIMYYR